MKLSYEEIEKYHNNGILQDVLTKSNMSWQDVMDVMFKQMSVIEDMETSYDNTMDRQENLEDEVDQLEHEISVLKDELESSKEELEELMSSYQDLEQELQELRDIGDE